MKTLITKKAIKERFKNIRSVDYCGLQHLLRTKEPFAYSTRVEGWSCDYYNIDGVIICTGYSAIGERVKHDLIESYDNKARAIWCNNISYEEQIAQIEKLLVDFMREI
jgi:hypothetical protein